MLFDWLIKLFKKKEPVIVSVEPEPGDVEETADTGSTEPSVEEPEPVVVEPEKEPKKPYDGVDFHILLDNGHAQSTPGKRKMLENGTYFYEYKFSREIVRRIAVKLDKLGIPYEILVPEIVEDIPLSTRAARANSFCSKYGTSKCFFISIHSNALGDGSEFKSAKGWSVWTTKGLTKSDRYATILFEVAQEELPKHGMTTRKDMSDGDPDYEENFTVIYKTWCPAVLTENMFFTNREEVHWLMSEDGMETIANIHVSAIRRIIDGQS